MRLTRAERLILVNQYRILAQLDEEEAEGYQEYIEILANGYEGFYDSVDESVHCETLLEEECGLVLDILSMYDWLASYMNEHPTDDEVLKHVWARFQGLDLNNEGKYWSFARFLLQVQGKFELLQAAAAPALVLDDYNSHQRMLGKYDRMVGEWRSYRGDPDPGHEQVLAVLEA